MLVLLEVVQHHLQLTLRADDLFTGVQKKYNGGRTVNITAATLQAAGFANVNR